MMISSAPAIDAVAIEMPKAMRLMRVGEAAISCRASWSCATAEIARPVKVRDRIELQRRRTSASAATHGTSMRSGKSIKPMRQRRSDIGRLDVAVVDAEHQDQHAPR